MSLLALVNDLGELRCPSIRACFGSVSSWG